jgi:hypothetical protein
MRHLSLSLVLFTLFACNGHDDSDHDHEVGPICQSLVDACHDPGEAGDVDAQACHDLGHDGDEAACEAEETACLATCTA